MEYLKSEYALIYLLMASVVLPILIMPWSFGLRNRADMTEEENSQWGRSLRGRGVILVFLCLLLGAMTYCVSGAGR
jgi:hypothetical protein